MGLRGLVLFLLWLFDFELEDVGEFQVQQSWSSHQTRHDPLETGLRSRTRHSSFHNAAYNVWRGGDADAGATRLHKNPPSTKTKRPKPE